MILYKNGLNYQMGKVMSRSALHMRKRLEEDLWYTWDDGGYCIDAPVEMPAGGMERTFRSEGMMLYFYRAMECCA